MRLRHASDPSTTINGVAEMWGVFSQSRAGGAEGAVEAPASARDNEATGTAEDANRRSRAALGALALGGVELGSAVCCGESQCDAIAARRGKAGGQGRGIAVAIVCRADMHMQHGAGRGGAEGHEDTEHVSARRRSWVRLRVVSITF